MDQLSLFKTPVSQELEEFKTYFEAALFHSNPLLNSVISHIQRSSGKMMRPILVLLAAKLYGKIQPTTLHAAVALELLHTASLIHDDVVDESIERRGQPSVNASFNNKIAVLMGDFLLAVSLAQVNLTQNHQIVNIVSRLGQELAEGELLQLSHCHDKSLSEEVYFDVIRKKTAVLFAGCMEAGALSTGATKEESEWAYQFGECVGICFQLKDDIFDYFKSKVLGKPTGKDMLEGQLTLPAIYALRTTSDEKAEKIAQKVKQGKATPKEISYLIDFSKREGGINYARQIMQTYREKGVHLLESLPNSPIKRALSAYLDYVVERGK